MAKMINLNADIAEGGAYDIGNDAELMKIIKSASVACGFRAAISTPCTAACGRKWRVSASAVRPGFNDLRGFGRRRVHHEDERSRSI